MNRKLSSKLALVLGVAMAFTAAAVAADDTAVTLEGQIVCAKCNLKEKDRTTCQNVLQVKGEKGETQDYYIAKNDVADKYGEVCTAVRAVKVTGVVTEKDGRKWIEARKIEDTKKG